MRRSTDAHHRLVHEPELLLLEGRRAGRAPAGPGGPWRCRRRGPAGRTQLLPAALAARSARSARRMVVGDVVGRVQLGDADAPGDVEDDAGRSQPARRARRTVAQVGDDPLGERGGLLEAVGDERRRTRRHRAGRPGRRRGRSAAAGGHLDQQVVPRLVTRDVVDRLEAVEVQEQQAGHAGPSAARASGGGQAGHQPGAVGQPGQVVGVGQPLELALGGAAPGDVAQVQHQPVAQRGAAARRRGPPPEISTSRQPPSCVRSRTVAGRRSAGRAGEHGARRRCDQCRGRPRASSSRAGAPGRGPGPSSRAGSGPRRTAR